MRGALWLVVALLGIAICSFLGGAKYWDDDEMVAGVVFSIIWPLVLIFMLIVGPFVLLHRLGRRSTHRHRRGA